MADLERLYDSIKDAQWFFIEKEDGTKIGFISHFLSAGETEIGQGESLMKTQSEVRVKRSRLLSLNGQSGLVFSLFGPIGEKKWAENWNPSIIFPESVVRQGSVFTTRDHEGAETIWIITRLNKKSRNIVYTSVTPSLKVSIIEINCEPDGTNHTKARVTYTITALSEKGKQYVTSMSKQHYHEWMTDWEKAINHYLQCGHPLRHH